MSATPTAWIAGVASTGRSRYIPVAPAADAQVAMRRFAAATPPTPNRKAAQTTSGTRKWWRRAPWFHASTKANPSVMLNTSAKTIVSRTRPGTIGLDHLSSGLSVSTAGAISSTPAALASQ